MDKPPKGQATLRVALAGADGNGGLAVGVNGQSVGAIRPIATNALRYNTDKGVWQERALPFDAALLKPGENEMQLTVPAGERHLRRRLRLPAPRTERGLPARHRAAGRMMEQRLSEAL